MKRGACRSAMMTAGLVASALLLQGCASSDRFDAARQALREVGLDDLGNQVVMLERGGSGLNDELATVIEVRACLDQTGDGCAADLSTIESRLRAAGFELEDETWIRTRPGEYLALGIEVLAPGEVATAASGTPRVLVKQFALRATVQSASR